VNYVLYFKLNIFFSFTYLVFSKLQFNIAVEHCSQLEEKVSLDFAQILSMYESFLNFFISIIAQN
jgi:hypothetical protein